VNTTTLSIPRAWSSSLALLVLALAGFLGGCATVAPPGGPQAAVSRADPFESFNRKVFAVLRPVAEAYRKAIPSLVRQGVSNFFGNVGDVWSAANQFLQGKLGNGLDMGMRVAVNTVFGFGGVLDISTDLGNSRKSEDFGQTLAIWGISSGPYLVLPLLGPSTLRDTAGVPVDRYYGSLSRFASDYNSYVTTTLQLVNLRSELLDAGKLANEVSLDKYIFFRDAWFSRRLDAIYDGSAPLENFDDDDDKKAPAKSAPPKK
jgi:phospholipid-binding lipoprotein MlaA